MPRLARKCSSCKGKLVDVNAFLPACSVCENCNKIKRQWEQRNINNKNIRQYKFLQDMLDRAKIRAKKKSIDFNIDLEYIKHIYPENNMCPYLKKKFVRGKGFSCATSPTIDRIDPTKGYVKGNVEIISMKANIIKNDSSFEEIEMVAKRLKEITNG